MPENDEKNPPVIGEVDTTVSEVNEPEVNPVSDTMPPDAQVSWHEDVDFPQTEILPTQTPEERLAEKNQRIAALVARLLPAVKARKIGFDARQPWLSNPHVEETVKATIEILYDLEFGTPTPE